jgi:2-methylisocitrate lyase-like PEP mutase family enzyme
MAPLRPLIASKRCIAVPGVYDCIGARLAEQAGFPAVAISGYGVEAARFGLPDLGFVGLSDMADVATRISASVSIPVICDVDTGFGGKLNVVETVRRMEAAGVSAIHFEDQTFPKKCGFAAGRTVIGRADMCDRIKAAVDARRSADFMIIARTDSRESLGAGEAAERLNAYLDAGADAAFAAELYTESELAALGRDVRGPLLVCAGVPGVASTALTLSDYERLGIVATILPFACLLPAVRAIAGFLAELRTERASRLPAMERDFATLASVEAIVRQDEWSRRAEAAS